MAESNPFGAPQPQQNQAPMAGNPFDPLGAQAATPPQQQLNQGQFKDPPQPAGFPGPSNPFGSTSAPPQQQVSPLPQFDLSQQNMGMPSSYSQPQQQVYAPADAGMHGSAGQTHPSQFAQPGYDSYGASPYAPQGQGLPYAPPQDQQATHAPQPSQDAIVVSQYQSNPYAGLVASAPSPYASTGATTAANPFDPFAAAPPPPAPAPEPAYTQQPQAGFPQPDDVPGFAAPPAAQQPPSFEDSNPLGPFGDPFPQQEPAPEPKPEPPEPRRHTEERHQQHPSFPPQQPTDRNKYSRELARNAPPGASPLPKAELVRKKGYVLARISFRTIVTKKWKQTFWVQYGPHTMLWFRSEADFDDWLNNPYHDQSQRNFLIKLAVNFVHDLYKPNVRGYQVTQCRTKAYGKKMVRQFKLERWMDYGPTIAAAFGSYDPKEVDVLREALVDCMRNTPLSGGIRATGAVRQRREEQKEDGEQNHPHTRPEPSGSFDSQQPARKDTDEAGEEADLLDVANWDDMPPQSPTLQYGHHDPAALAQAPPPEQFGALQGQPSPYGAPQQYQQPQYQQHSQQQYPQPQQQQIPVVQGQDYQNAMVPLGAPHAYPGAPPMQPPPQQQQQQQPPYGGYPAQPPQDPWAVQQPQQPPSPQQQPQYQMGY